MDFAKRNEVMVVYTFIWIIYLTGTIWTRLFAGSLVPYEMTRAEVRDKLGEERWSFERRGIKMRRK